MASWHIEVSRLGQGGRVGEVFDGRLDVFFNAGIFTAGMVGAATKAIFTCMFGVNVTVIFLTIQKALALLAVGSSVIVTTSMLGILGTPGVGPSAASKVGQSMVKTFASELTSRSIRVNAVAPGPVDTISFKTTGLPTEMLSARLRMLFRYRQ